MSTLESSRLGAESSVLVIPSYELLDEVDSAGLKVATVRAALELDLFSAVAAGASDERSLAIALGCSHRGIRVLTRALLSLGLLEGTPTSLACGATASAYLVGGSDGCSAPILLSWFRNRDHLVDAIRTGESMIDHGDPAHSDEWLAYSSPDLVRWPLREGSLVERIIDQLGVRIPAGGRLLDLGCGSGIVGCSLARHVDGLSVVAVDRPSLMPVVSRLATQMGVADRVHTIGGDALSVDLEDGTFDVILLLNVAQYLSDDDLVATLRRCAQCLRDGGQLLLATPIVDDGEPGNATNWQTMIEMYLASPYDQRDEARLVELLHVGGLQDVRRVGPFTLVATRRDQRPDTIETPS